MGLRVSNPTGLPKDSAGRVPVINLMVKAPTHLSQVLEYVWPVDAREMIAVGCARMATQDDVAGVHPNDSRHPGMSQSDGNALIEENARLRTDLESARAAAPTGGQTAGHGLSDPPNLSPAPGAPRARRQEGQSSDDPAAKAG